MTISKFDILTSLLKPNTIVKTSEYFCIIISDLEHYNARKMSGNIPSVKLKCKIIAPNLNNKFFEEDYYIGQVVDVDESISYMTKNWSIID